MTDGEGGPGVPDGHADVGGLVVRCHEALAAAGATVATAESLTGGLLAAVLTEVPGASRTVRGGVVAYDVGVKEAVLGVPGDLLARHGPVHAATARAMAEGARRHLAATYALATTGVAGPDPHGDQPVGTVHLACAGPQGTVDRTLRLDGDRDRIRASSVREALDLLLRTLPRQD